MSEKYIADPNGRDTIVQCFKFNLCKDESAETHIRRLRTIIRYLPSLQGDTVVGPNQLRHIVIKLFPKKWQESFIRGGTKRYHTA